MKNASGFLLRLLVDPRYRIVRHFLLFFLSLLIIYVNFYVALVEGNAYLIRISIVQSFILLFFIYLSVFVLTPRLLLKNKPGQYVLSVMLVIALAHLLSYLLRQEDIDKEYQLYQFWLSAFFLISSTIQFSLLIVGASAVIVFQDYVKYGQRIDRLENATMQSELEQLKNQINPHFLFNMLNNANVLISENPVEAVHVLSKLKDLLKYQLKDSTSETVRLADDIRFLTDYLNMEKIRRDNFSFLISVEAGMEDIIVPPLLFIPFVENAVKHNNDNRKLSYVRLYFRMENEMLIFICVNSKPAQQKEKEETADGGIGLANIRRRLQLLYDTGHSLQITETDITYTVDLRLKL